MLARHPARPLAPLLGRALLTLLPHMICLLCLFRSPPVLSRGPPSLCPPLRLQRGRGCTVRVVVYSRASLPRLVEIQAHPPADPSCQSCALSFTFMGEATAPPPPMQTQGTASCAEGSDRSGVGSGSGMSRPGSGNEIPASSNASCSSSSSASASPPASRVDMGRSSTADHAFIATELHAPWRILSCNQRW